MDLTLERGAQHRDARSKARVVEPGPFEVLVGTSSAEIRLRKTVELR